MKFYKPTGVVLPALSNPATASDIASGKQAIDGAGNLFTGTGELCKTGMVQASNDNTMIINDLANYTYGIVYIDFDLDETAPGFSTSHVIYFTLGSNNVSIVCSFEGLQDGSEHMYMDTSTINILSNYKFIVGYYYRYVLWN